MELTIKYTNKPKMVRYILDSIDVSEYSGYEDCNNNDALKIHAVVEIFEAEKSYELKRKPTKTREVFSDWLAGLPTCMNIAWENYRILEVGKELGLLDENANEYEEDIFLEQWFDLVSFVFWSL